MTSIISSDVEFIKKCTGMVLSGDKLTISDAAKLFNIPDDSLKFLSSAANEITRRYNGDKVDVEQLYNIKKNACSEDCTFCGQSAFFDTAIDTWQLPPAKDIVKEAKKAFSNGAESYCLVAAWREPSKSDFEKVCNIIQDINQNVGISIECSLGFLTEQQAKSLKNLGVKRYNHNLETARSKFSEICTTQHTKIE